MGYRNLLSPGISLLAPGQAAPRQLAVDAGAAWPTFSPDGNRMAYAAQDRDTSVSEMNRYLGWPGQAIAYKVGQQAIRDLRSEMSARPGFDLKAFHAKILEIGSTGLDVLRVHVRGR